ncbi:MAG: HIT domain-containing protein [Candidatus Nanoarchaeia archaeon]|nr:HIT domain-containing protein [Candidatus Nanoarchaeia archaeon]
MNSKDTGDIKRQLIENIEANLPKDKGDVLKRQIVSMSDEQLESFLKRSGAQNEGCIFCSIASGKAESFKISESDSAVAVLEINPASKGHTIVIPKKHIPVESFPPEIKSFAGGVSQVLKDKLNPGDIEISSQDLGGHGIMNLVPVYKEESINSGRYKAEKEELRQVSEALAKKEEIKEEPKKEKKHRPEKISDKKFWLPKRIP